MARKRRRVAASKRRRRSPALRSVRRRRVSHRARVNPRRHRRRRSNPGFGGIGGQVKKLGMEAVATLAGQALGRTISGAIPIGGASPIANFAKGAAVAILIRKVGPRVVSQDMAQALAVGALMGPLKDLLVSYVPQAAGFLGSYSMGAVTYLPPIPNRMGSYAGSAEDMDDSESLGSYSGDVVQ